MAPLYSHRQLVVLKYKIYSTLPSSLIARDLEVEEEAAAIGGSHQESRKPPNIATNVAIFAAKQQSVEEVAQSNNQLRSRPQVYLASYCAKLAILSTCKLGSLGGKRYEAHMTPVVGV